MTYESLFAIGDEVKYNGDNCVVTAIRFTKSKVFYEVLDEYHGELYKNIPSEYITNAD